MTSNSVWIQKIIEWNEVRTFSGSLSSGLWSFARRSSILPTTCFLQSYLLWERRSFFHSRARHNNNALHFDL